MKSWSQLPEYNASSNEWSQALRHFGDNPKELESQFESAFHDIKKKLDTITPVLSRALKEGPTWDSMKCIYNNAAFTLLVSGDIKACQMGLILSKSTIKRWFYFKSASVLLFETSKVLLDLFGKDFRMHCHQLSIENNLIESLNVSTRALAKFKNHHENSLAASRNQVGAHRNRDSMVHIAEYENFSANSLSFIQLVTEYEKILMDISVAYQPVLMQATQNFISSQQASTK